MFFVFLVFENIEKKFFYDMINFAKYNANISGCGVTANMLVLGTSDSGFESQHPDTNQMRIRTVCNLIK